MIKNNKIFNTCSKAGGVLFCVFIAALFAVLGANVSYAQTAMVTSVSTNYPKEADAYQNYQCDVGTPSSVSFLYDPDILTEYDSTYNTLSDNVDPWHNSALIEYDQPFPYSLTGDQINYYPNHCLQLCATVTCANPSRKVEASDGSTNSSLILTQDVASSSFPIQSVLFEIFKYQPNSNPYNADTTPPIRTIALTPVDNNVCYGVGTYITNAGSANEAMNSCCDLFNQSSTASGSCQSSSCHDITSSALCGTTTGCYWKSQTKCYTKTDAASQSFCTGRTKASCQAKWGCEWINSNNTCIDKCSKLNQSACGLAQNCIWENRGACNTSSSNACTDQPDAASCSSTSGCTWVSDTISGIAGCDDTLQHYANQEQCLAGITNLSFCTAWDGSYEIDGEFGKSNGQFGFRANVKTKWPGDGISSGGDVEVDHTMAYPGENQIPIQIDVTNVHSVRSSSTMVGTTTKVPVQPYDLTYKLSKDALTTIKISDPGEQCDCAELEDIFGYSTQCLTSGSLDYTKPADYIDFDLITRQPRLGEGIPDGTNTNLDSWDGRDVRGRFLPYGNYLVGITATTHDEWSGDNMEDLSRTVTRQLSLDPLKITDISETGLAKLSTSYAKIDYVLTEDAEVHVLIFTPGSFIHQYGMDNEARSATDIDNNIITSVEGTGSGSFSSRSGQLVSKIIEQKQGRVNVNTKWDGICRRSGGCTYNGTLYKEGTPMPDGDYVYVIWAEIPYSLYDNDPNKTHFVCVNGKWWAGVRTHKYYNGILPINRGLPEITVSAVGYTSLGSSPTAFGLDPFTFNYSVSRDSIVDATIKTTAPDMDPGATDQIYNVKHLLTNEVVIAAKENKFTWDGIDDEGYQVSPGTYMVEFVVKDSLYPEKQATMTVQFPVDMFRVVDVSTTPILDEATSQATISYTLSKSMDVIVEIYDQSVTIPTKDCVNPSDPDENCWCHYEGDNLIPVAGATPLKSFILPRAGEGMTITEVWDGLQQSIGNTSAVAPLPDGNYPYRICTRTTQDISHWYNETSGVHVAQNGDDTANLFVDGASDKPTGFITIARGSIAFNKVLITPSQPTMKYSSETIYLPAYEIGFSTSRPASVNIEVLSTQPDQCLGTSPAGTICRTLSTYAYNEVDGYFDPTKLYKVYWDGKDSKGQYVKYGSYEIKLVGLPYPMPAPSVFGDLPLETIFSQVISVNNFQVYDRYVEDITRENPNGKFAYQISVPMKVAIQIFKPGTMTNRDSTTAKATGLIDPITQGQVDNADINNVLVKSIVGIRPNLVSLDEVWDGTDYAGQEVPDGIYPYRYVTVLNAYDMDSVTGALNIGTDPDTLATAGAMVADWEKYITLEHINVARGDSWYADIDWKSKKVTSFFPNPLKGNEGWFEITKLPAPGYLTIKIFNIAGDLVRDGNFECVNAQGVTDTLSNINATGGLQPYMMGDATQPVNTVGGRNFTLRCKWEKDNNHGKKVARGLYYAIMELNPTRGNAKKSQRVIKILIP